MVCTWGRIRRPFGAALSMGITSTTVSPGSIKSPIIVGAVHSFGAERTISFFKSSMPARVAALTGTSLTPSIFSNSGWSASGFKSILFSTPIRGTPCSSAFLIRFNSYSPASCVGSITKIIRSDLFNTPIVFLILISPSSPASSIPAVSIITTGPTGRISIDLYTGSVVVPGTFETIAISWLVRALTRLDLPAFRLPKTAMCSLLPRGVSFKLPVLNQSPPSLCHHGPFLPAQG